MRKLWRIPAITLLLATTFAPPWAADEPASAAPVSSAPTAALPRYQQSRATTFLDWLADGSLLVRTEIAGRQQISRIRQPLGQREQLTFAPTDVTDALARPGAADSVLTLSSEPEPDGALSLLSLTDRSQILLSDGQHRDLTARWSHDGKRLALASNRRDGVDFDVYTVDTTQTAPLPRYLVGSAGERWRVLDWSLDDQRLLLARAPTRPPAKSSDAALFVVDINTARLSPIPFGSAAEAAATQPISAARFAGDGHSILLSSFRPADGTLGTSAGNFLHVSQLTAGGTWLDLGPMTGQDVEWFDQSADGRYLAYSVNDNGTSRLMLSDRDRKLELSINQLPAGVISGLKFDPSGQRLAITVEANYSPADVYVLEPQTNTLTRWTQSETGSLNVQSFAQPMRLQLPGWDRVDGRQRQLLAFIYRPQTLSQPRPVVLVLCGGGNDDAGSAVATGPRDSRGTYTDRGSEQLDCRPGYAPFIQYMVNELGLVVVTANIRGAAGYGREFLEPGEQANGSRREDAVRDVGSLLSWIGLQPSLDRTHVVLMGSGASGYLALESLSQYSERLQGAVVSTPTHLARLVNAVGIRRPLLIVQDESDPIAPAFDVARLRAQLNTARVEVQYVALPAAQPPQSQREKLSTFQAAAAGFLIQHLL